jgi:hypothetical protein
MEQTECSETSVYTIQTPGNYPEESIQHSEHGESFKSKNMHKLKYDYDRSYLDSQIAYHRSYGSLLHTVTGNAFPINQCDIFFKKHKSFLLLTYIVREGTLKMRATWYSLSLSTAIFTSEAEEFGSDFLEMVDFCVRHNLRDFKPPPRRKSGLHTSAVSRSIGLLLPTLRDNLLVPSLRLSLLKMGLTGCPERSVTGYQSTLRYTPEERRFRETWIMQP